MLSFDITDRRIRIVRGTEAGGKIRVSSATTIDVQEGLVVNGHIKDIPKMATIINDEIRARRMDDKEAVVTLSSNLVIFKEMALPKEKSPAKILTMVTNEMQTSYGIAEDYSVSYSIVGSSKADGEAEKLNVLATACPFEVVDCYRKVFDMLSIALKSVSVSCNAITRVILSDKKSISKMPMLVVQVDPNFVSLNLYENDQLSFARFASIDAVDYDNSDDYVFEAVNENISRMIQFHKSRSTGNPIQNVVFYGDTTEYIRLTNALEGMDISTSLLGVPNNISGYENIEFQAYANAIGAMFRSDKNERINLLETDSSAGRVDADSSFFLYMGIAALLSAAVVGAGVFGYSSNINKYNSEIADIDARMNSPENLAKMQEVEDTEIRIGKVDGFKKTLDQAVHNLKSKPDFTSELHDTIFELYASKECGIETMGFGSGHFVIEGVAPEATIPDQVVQSIYELDQFDNIVYNGFSISSIEIEGQEKEEVFKFTVEFEVRPNEIEGEETPAAAEEEKGGAEE